MDSIIFTERLKLTLVTEAAKGSPEYEWFSEVWSDEKATWWSISGRAKTPSDVERMITRDVPSTSTSGDNTNEDPMNKYKIVYAVHQLLDSTTISTTSSTSPTKFIGLITLHALTPKDLQLRPHLTPPNSNITNTSDTLCLEIAYMFLPTSWNQGFATEALRAFLAAAADDNKKAFWGAQYDKVHVRAIVNALNPASSRVLEKVGVERMGEFEWKGEKPVFLAGSWRTRDDLIVHGGYVVE